MCCPLSRWVDWSIFPHLHPHITLVGGTHVVRPKVYNQKAYKGSKVAYDVAFQLDYVAGPQLNTPILQQVCGRLALVTLVFALAHVQSVVRLLKSG